MSDDLLSDPDTSIEIKLHCICLEMSDVYSHKIKKTVIENLDIKKKFYKNEQYLSELEKEYVYFHESTKLFVRAITHYLKTGEPNIRPAEIKESVSSARFSPSKDTVMFHLKYLHSDYTECSVHEDYKDMKRGRRCLLATGCYTEFLEDNYIDEQAINLVALILFRTVLENRRYFAGSYSKNLPEDILDIVKEWVRLYGLVCIGKIHIPKY